MAAKLTTDGLRRPDTVALGPDQAYYARWPNGTWSCWASEEFIADVENCMKGYEIFAVAFGYGGSYVISYGKHRKHLENRFNLKRYYPGLVAILQQKVSIRVSFPTCL